MAQEEIDYTEVNELVANIFNLPDADDQDAIDEKLAHEYNISSEDYQKIVEDIFKRLDFSISPLTQTAYVGITQLTPNGKRGGVWIAKKEVDQQFIAAMIEWATEGTNIPKGPGKGFVKEITVGGKVEYVFTIQNPGEKPKPKNTVTIKAEPVVIFDTFQQWVNNAASTLGGFSKKEKIICIDKNGNGLTSGEDFEIASVEKLFPVTAYRVIRTVEINK